MAKIYHQDPAVIATAGLTPHRTLPSNVFTTVALVLHHLQYAGDAAAVRAAIDVDRAVHPT